MLKQLELVGFKSFADKTQFDFCPGITAVVGPNGSGKSNVVDAVRWILGEQSAKSLRGGEMTDVIFNGSTSRRGLGLAEVTMTFDNSRHVLATDADEVQITRRVYRSGEGEYLINHQISRLKDIKDLFLGSGAGADAYCVIEQGKVDVLLQASTRERRTIFEEAAGISRFKAKKVETLRKLERVEQNLQRLKDIIDEVEKQLRSVKLQAAKAQRHQEYSQRLRELRLALGLDEYQQLSERLAAETAVLDELRAGLQERAAQVEAWEKDSKRLEETLARLDEALHKQETLLGSSRQQIAAEETTLGHERSLSAELETDLAATRSRLTELSAHVSTLAGAAAAAAKELQQVELQSEDQRGQAQSLEEQLNAAVSRLTELHSQVQSDKSEHLEKMRQAARLHNDVVSYQAQVDNLRRERDRLLLRTEQASEHLATLDLELLELTQADEAQQAHLAAARQRLINERRDREGAVQQCDDMARTVGDLRAQSSGLASRIEVLEALERGHEGLGTGVREVMALLDHGAGSNGDAPTYERKAPTMHLWARDLIPGIVADFLTVHSEYAPLIDLALGDRAQRFLVRDPERLAEALRLRPQPFSGRVSFLPLAARAKVESGAPDASANVSSLMASSVQSLPKAALRPDGISEYPGAVAWAKQVVTCDDPELADLPAQLLGQTLIVRDLNSARTIAARAAGLRFVTLQGELLEPDGTVTVGTHHAEMGILSRKSELRELRLKAIALDQQISQAQNHLIALREGLAALDTRIANLQEQIDVQAEQAADLRSRLGQRQQRRQGLHEEVSLSRSEISGVEQEIKGLAESLHEAKTQAETVDRQVQTLQAGLEQADREIRNRESERQQRQQDVTSAKVALGKVEERLNALRAKHRQIQTDLDQRRQERAVVDQRLKASCTRLAESQRTMLEASSALAHCYLQKEAAERRVAELTRERDLERQERQLLSDRAQHVRNEWRAQQEQAHGRELEVNDLSHRRDGLADRLREDYQIELADLYGQRAQAIAGVEKSNSQAGTQSHEPVATGNLQPPAALDPAAANDEIAELRRKLSRLGSVNLDSLQELADLENRSQALQTQFDDLTAAKRSLEEIISTINNDSRRLFSDCFVAIRTHFQELFRKLFGGGMADIILEDEVDILESGIEIIARPPGKELRSISLMSGGEKTLTAVALLLAIFRSRPSPFCILDEVDAALDEANIGRFTAVLRDFLDRSQFIIITHSKKTMAVADVLYGITMQESGVSKRVAVRFDDWPDDTPATTDEPIAVARNGQ